MDDELLFRSLSGKTSGSEEALLRAWRRDDPANEERYQKTAAMFAAAIRADARRADRPSPQVAELLRAAARNDPAKPEPENARPRWRSWTPRLIAAAAILAVGFAASELRPRGLSSAFGADEFVTGPKETATVSLRDGSVVRLAPMSRLRLTGQANDREVALSGRGYFSVAKQSGRPFRIKTSAGDVTVLGTRFALEAEREDLRLVVVEGRVSLSSRGQETQVAAGEIGRVVKGTTLPVTTTPEPDVPVAWVGNFLAFQTTPLEEAAREIERQFKVRIAITDSALGSRTITGWFAEWSLDEVLDVVCVIANATCSQQSGVVTMRPRAVR